ncbi:hypothetical protein [Crossiella cryophila]|uniref:Uncharacterized protein n=1 Tax=Crossiella cryophila TaxID=43355 RepID=A0A7W7FTW2_9PSEU|nr:hypothetical protein [Crossiella cryophila]MBB4677435.1 hypothetical protein [Crossiella cryophila]
MGDRIFGARRHLESVFVAVLLIPVVPDLFVDWLGDPGQPQHNGVLRVLAVVAVFTIAVLVGIARNAWVRLRGERARRPFTPLPAADVLVLPISARSNPYLRKQRRDRGPEVPEFLCDESTPKTVVGVLSPRTASMADDLAAELAADGIEFRPVLIDNAHSPVGAVEGSGKVLDQLRDLDVPADRVLIDVTGGSVPLTLAMMRVAGLLGARCVYVSADVGSDGRLVPYSQRGYAFDPRAITGEA